MTIQYLLPNILGDVTEEHIEGYIYRMWSKGRDGRIIYPKHAKCLRIPVSTLH